MHAFHYQFSLLFTVAVVLLAQPIVLHGIMSLPRNQRNAKYKPLFLIKNKALDYMGCFPSGINNDTMGDGLSLAMINATCPMPSTILPFKVPFCLLSFKNVLTVELCSKICFGNGYKYVGLSHG